MNDDENGFTLIELLVSILVMGVVFGAVSAAFIISVRSTAESNERLLDANDAGIIATYFVKDVASSKTASSIAPTCGAPAVGSQLLLSLRWPDGTAEEKVDYLYGVTGPQAGTLVRRSCGATASVRTIGRNLTTAPAVACTTATCKQVDLTLVIEGSSRVLTGTRRLA